MDRSLEVLWLLVVLGLGEAQYYPTTDFSSGCTVPSDNYGPPILLPPFLCHVVVRESARALGLLEPFVPVQFNNQLQSASRAVSVSAINYCNPPTSVARAIECRRLEPPPTPPPMQTARLIDCNQQTLPGARAIECNPPPPMQMPTARAVDCNALPNAPDCYPPPQPQPIPAGRFVECNLVPIPASRFVGCGPVLPVQEPEPVTPPPCPQVCTTLCAGCQNAVQARPAEEAMVEVNQAGRSVNGSPYSYNLIPVKMKSKTPGPEDPLSHLLLLQLKSDNKKSESDDASRTNTGRSLA